ncbi:PQQ-binding-like beta-propeller repeat protein [Methylobacter sp.]|uniref:outer membrane protein assembly factor BamB family protein n=1 Tax=Methylobacter sp. TaxID=2051955 RepID=UPI003DA21166
MSTSTLIRLAAWVFLCVVSFSGTGQEGEHKDPHIVRHPGELKEDANFVSPPTLGFPIYACGTAITVSNYILGAKIEVFIDGSPAPNPSFIAQANPLLGQTHDTGFSFTEGKVIYVTQTYNGATSAHSNSVTVTSHTADYPKGLPKPRLFKHPLYECGHAVLVEDVVPNSQVTIHAEDPDGAGGFKPEVDVGGFQASTSWGLNWSGVNPQFTLGARVIATAKICTDPSPRSDPEITVTGPTPMPPGSTEKPVIDGQTLINIWGENGPPNDPPAHGAIVTLRDVSATIRGQSAIPGGVSHTLGIGSPAAAGEQFTVTQTLCTESTPGTPTAVEDCSALPAPIIKPPLPGDTKIIVTYQTPGDQIPGAEILVFASGQEIGHASGSSINLSRALNDGENVIVVQKLGKCTGNLVYQINVECALGSAPGACSSDWPAFRQNGLRTARQVQASPLGDPYAVKTLQVKASVTAPDGGVFVASPVIYDGRVFIGSNHGHLYAFDANFAEGATPLWQYPPIDEPALDSSYAAGSACHNPSSEGIAASVAIAQSERGPLVILAGPDRGRPSDPGGRFGSGLGSGRVFALSPATGDLVWKTREEVARMSGTTSGSFSEFHEQIGYSSPLVLGHRIYVGVADHCDNPIQNGRVKAINIDTGAIDGGFNYQSTSDRGGGVWTYVSGGLANALVTTTGNVKNGTSSEPVVNHGLSMVRIDPTTGTVNGKIQPVPWINDGDPDWSAGATLMAASCGDIAASTMKDGFSYGGNLGAALTFRWQYPSVSYPFPINDPLHHGDIRYHRAGAGWNDTYVTMAGGQQIFDQSDPVLTYQGYRRLHGINVCSGAVRWMAMLDAYTNPVSSTHDWALGPPTVTDGIVYVGTNRGFLLAIADPSVWPSQGAQCTLPTLATADCVAAGYQLVPNPTVLKSLDLGGVILRGEPALANGMVYVANSSGRLFRIAPEK